MRIFGCWTPRRFMRTRKSIDIALEKHQTLDQRNNVVYGDMCHHGIKRIIKKYSNAVKVDALNCIDCLLGGHQKLLEATQKATTSIFLQDGCPPTSRKTSISAKSSTGTLKA